MIWSYLHQHIGAINGTLLINGKHHCTDYPIIGTDPGNTPGNEKGFVVRFTSCVDKNLPAPPAQCSIVRSENRWPVVYILQRNQSFFSFWNGCAHR